ncbi:putative transcriptional regulator, MerR family [Mycolicibacterium vanbaalenii PYR-1]|jgi:DNA-binding transcriptional MerR regulator|uniref:Transcriptional regulator, MerR family n=1 Tax=Mycolicibacterium vanbaalenii (strain DSM 7251 / JCM 13017 / BCRC 16820 / KCTC 9966 / NRRL B-24157 / PYR-1) TaxID=350058 RepID=A1TCK3_MYCVP|nr:putative transcriptional regulator, MerR family [Mycolicibacterium vanbaalenii PYR-1]
MSAMDWPATCYVWGPGVAEYRLEDLARESGISARNIRAYRERGLLDPPRRVGRSALYDDYHLSQLNTISQLLRKGYNSAHIAEFFASMRQGTDLADILGLQRAVLGQTPEPRNRNTAVKIDAKSEEARKLVAFGMAEVVDGEVLMIDCAAADILARSPDQLLYVRALLRFVEAAEDSVDDLAEAFVTSLGELYHARVGADYLPRPDEVDEIRQVVQDYRALGEKVMVARFDQATRRRMVASASGYTAGILLSGAWEPKRGA